MAITADTLIGLARSLRCDGPTSDNPEYERALVELVTDVLATDETIIALEMDHDGLREYVTAAILGGRA